MIERVEETHTVQQGSVVFSLPVVYWRATHCTRDGREMVEICDTRARAEEWLAAARLAHPCEPVTATVRGILERSLRGAARHAITAVRAVSAAMPDATVYPVEEWARGIADALALSLRLGDPGTDGGLELLEELQSELERLRAEDAQIMLRAEDVAGGEEADDDHD